MIAEAAASCRRHAELCRFAAIMLSRFSRDFFALFRLRLFSRHSADAFCF